MTGGHVVVLGPAGRNFGAGMSGGIAYVLDETGTFAGNVNTQMVGIESVDDPAEAARLRTLVERHATLAGSTRAAAVLAAWDRALPRFVKVIPKDYKRMLAAILKAQDQGLTGDEAIMVAFEENARDLARVGGN
jgi:glutamate synthase (ferredoxin)